MDNIVKIECITEEIIKSKKTGKTYKTMDDFLKENKMEDLQNDEELSIENKYLEYTKGYIKKNDTLQIDYDWIYYYIYIILFIDGNLDLYNSIVVKLIHDSDFLDEDKKEKIKMIMINCGKTPDV